MFRPPIPSPAEPDASHHDLLHVLKGRLIEATYAEGKGLALPKAEIRQAAEVFVQRELAAKSLNRLQCIERIPRTTITLDFLLATGLLKSVHGKERCTIYYKFVEVPRSGIELMSRSKSASGSRIGKEILESIAPDHNEPIHVLHVGRQVSGLNNRKATEVTELVKKAAAPDKVFRPWLEAVSHSEAGTRGVKYWILSDLSRTTGFERLNRLVSPIYSAWV
jgi:hypothetical protein